LAAVTLLATSLLSIAQWRWFDPAPLTLAWTLTASVLLAAGLRGRMADVRLQAFVLFGVAALRAVAAMPRVAGSAFETIAWLAGTIAVYLSGGLLSRGPLARLAAAGLTSRVEVGCRVGLLVTGAGLLTILLSEHLRPTLVTLAWGLEGATLLGVGFPTRERALRLSGLVLLLFCVLKLFFVDLSTLEPLARIVSFVVLGLVLLGVSWTYTRYRDQIRKLL
jgi:hypothetical protein